MHLTPLIESTHSRRQFLMASAVAAMAWPVQEVMAGTEAAAIHLSQPDDAAHQLRQGGVVVMLRHALAPGTFDPPEFTLSDCRTQRNLNATGRAQAQQIGHWFARAALKPESVLASPWCRCMDTATLAFGTAQPWDALASPVGSTDLVRQKRLQALQVALREASSRRGFQVWVTHNFVVSDLTGADTQSGEGLLLKADASGVVQIVGRLVVH